MLIHGIVDAAIGDAHDVKAGFQIRAALHGLVNGVVHAFQHRGQDLAGVHVVLVAVHADRQDAFVGSGLQNTNAGAACGCIDHVRTLADLCLGQFRALYRVVPGLRGGAGHVGNHGGIGVHRLDALGITTGEFADQGDVHAADKADGARRGFHRGHHTHQIGAFVFVKHDRTHVGRIHDHVDDREFGVRIIGGYFGQHVAKGKAGHHDGVGTGIGKAAQRLFTLSFGLQFNLAEGAAGFFGPTGRAGKGGFVEGFVKFAAKVKDHGGFGHRGPCGHGKSGSSAEEFGHKGHWLLPVGMRQILNVVSADSRSF